MAIRVRARQREIVRLGRRRDQARQRQRAWALMRRIRRVLLAFTKEVSRLSCGTVAQQSHGVQLALRHPASWANAAMMSKQIDPSTEHPEHVMRRQRE
ncbi:hypothetical protein BVH03_06535 [Pseudomonas sp. PA15(2017)]|nr:hypothetical protein BVH03_06535 [Pseudomonas sp. PA15(2017)]